MPADRQLFRLPACVVFIGLFASSQGHLIEAQSSGERVRHAAAGISIVPPAGWHQLVPAPGDTATDSRSRSASERDAFLEQLGEAPSPMLFVFAKSVQIEDAMEAPTILIRVMPTALPGPRPLDILIAAMEHQADPRIAQPIRRTVVSGLPAAHALMRDTVTIGTSSFTAVGHGYLVPLSSVILVIEMKAPESSPEATNQVFAEALASLRIER